MTARPYAADTTVSSPRSRAEIEEMLARAGADAFSSGWEGNRAGVEFRLNGRVYRLSLDIPAANAQSECARHTRRPRLYTGTDCGGRERDSHHLADGDGVASPAGFRGAPPAKSSTGSG